MEQAFETLEIRACFDDHKNFMNIDIPVNLKVYKVVEDIPLEMQED